MTSQRRSALGGGRDAFERTLDSRDTKIPASEEGGYDITGPAFLKLRCPGALDHHRISLLLLLFSIPESHGEEVRRKTSLRAPNP